MAIFVHWWRILSGEHPIMFSSQSNKINERFINNPDFLLVSGMYQMYKTYTITKRISKHGSQAVITIPKLIENELRPGTVAEIKITVLKEAIE